MAAMAGLVPLFIVSAHRPTLISHIFAGHVVVDGEIEFSRRFLCRVVTGTAPQLLHFRLNLTHTRPSTDQLHT